MCSIVSEAPSAMTSLLLSKSRSRCGTAPSVAMACVARTELIWHSAQRGNAPHLRHHSTSQVHQLHVFPAHGDDALAAHHFSCRQHAVACTSHTPFGRCYENSLTCLEGVSQ